MRKVVLALPTGEVDQRAPVSRQNRWIEATKSLVIGSINAEDANVAPR